MSITTIFLTTLLSSSTPSKVPQEIIDSTFVEVSSKYKVPVNLLRAICWAESSHNTIAYNHGDGGDSNSSFGLCQVLYTTARESGFNDPNCEEDFSDKKYRTYENCKLFGIKTNISWAARILKKKLDKYNGSWINAIAAYNTGSLIICKTGWLTRQKDKKRIARCKINGYVNQVYIDRVLRALEERR